MLSSLLINDSRCPSFSIDSINFYILTAGSDITSALAVTPFGPKLPPSD